jgi:O-succinylbenzoate synthase
VIFSRVENSHESLRFAFKAYRRPFRVPVRMSRSVWEKREGVLIRIEREDEHAPGGLRAALGEIAPLPAFGTETFAGALAWCASLGERPEAARLRDVPRELPCCAFAIASALRALEEIPLLTERSARTGISKNSPLREERDSAPPPQRLSVALLLPTGAPALDALARGLGQHFGTFKLKIGAGDFVAERRLIDRLCGQLPPHARLRLDANGGLDVRSAARWLDAADAWPVEFIEQPLPAEASERDVVGLARDHATPLALDESVRGADDIKRWRDRDWRGVFVIKPALAGAPHDLIREIAIAPDQFVFSSALETDVGAAAGLHLAFASGISRALGYGVGAFFPDDGFGGAIAQPWLAERDIATLMKPEDAWNRL